MVTFVRKQAHNKWHIASRVGDAPITPGITASTRCSSQMLAFRSYTILPDNPDQVRPDMGTAIQSGDPLCATCALSDEGLNEVFVKAGGADPQPSLPVRPEGGVWVNANKVQIFPVTIEFGVHDEGGWSQEAREQFRQEFVDTMAPILELMSVRHNVSVRWVR